MLISDVWSDWCASDLRARGTEMVEAHGSVDDNAADQAEHAFEPLGRQARLADDAGAKAGGLSFDGVEDRVGRRVFLIVPVPAIRQLGRELLAKEAGDMAARGREAIVDGGGDQHLDDRRLRPAVDRKSPRLNS